MGGVVSASPHPTTEVFAFSPPKIKGDTVAFDAVFGAGKRTELHGTRPVWHALTRYLLQVFPDLGKRAVTAPKATRAGRKFTGRIIDPAVRTSYLLAYRDHRAGLHRSLAESCEANGCTYASAYKWIRDHADSCAAEAAALPPAPYLTPSGKIL